MSDYRLTAAQKQYDNAEPPRYNCKPVRICYYCGSDIYKGEKHAVIYGTYICCIDCLDMYIDEGDEE